MATPENHNGRARSGFLTFWTSLPGILTGLAAVIGAAATFAALFIDDADKGSELDGAPARNETRAGSASAGAGCFVRYFEGVSADRVAPVEVGTVDFDVIEADQPKTGTIGLTFTDNNRPIGATRFAFFPTTEIFKIESIVDQRCRTIEEYSNTSRGGDKHVLQNFDTLRLSLGGDFYDLRLGGSTTIRLSFVSVVP